ncbi:uncharacterized protein DNG_00986 [Cephalotrichum gorgonifer]|uniref:FHA domain-containing protein n=1 Tax=Cephalotrichum gorgonifer TaxID=2041049 RepID=A0AAE8MPP8_9PEZI|nr:uncharacterized protein DNG_00986 [Cephalotrichum gorgonifer]
MPANYVIVSLSETKQGENSHRRIRLDEQNDTCLVGRASSKGVDILARPDNGYFENPVRVYIKDVGSTHGTFVNNVRLPSTVRHPIRNGDTVTLGVAIKAQGVEVAQPSMMKVGIKFRMNSSPMEGVTNVFQVPDETSVEGSEPEDTLDRARRFLNVHDGYQGHHNTIDLTEDTTLPLEMAIDPKPVPRPAQVESEDSESSSDSDFDDSEEEEELQAQEMITQVESQDLELEADKSEELEPEVDDTMRQPAEELAGEVKINSSPEESSTGHNESEAHTMPLCTTKEPETGALFDTESSGQSLFDTDLSERGLLDTDSSEQTGDSPAMEEEDSYDEHVVETATSKKRKATEMSTEEEPHAAANAKVAPALDALCASGVQTDLAGEREPKRLRRAADIVGYAALGGLAGGLALFTTLVVSAPSFS